MLYSGALSPPPREFTGGRPHTASGPSEYRGDACNRRVPCGCMEEGAHEVGSVREALQTTDEVFVKARALHMAWLCEQSAQQAIRSQLGCSDETATLGIHLCCQKINNLGARAYHDRSCGQLSQRPRHRDIQNGDVCARFCRFAEGRDPERLSFAEAFPP